LVTLGVLSGMAAPRNTLMLQIYFCPQILFRLEPVCCMLALLLQLPAGVFEVWLHPSRYRTQTCKDAPHCTRQVRRLNSLQETAGLQLLATPGHSVLLV
jgi:hypothetical protein